MNLPHPSQEAGLLRNADRYRFIRECMKDKDLRIWLQAIVWNNESRGEFDAAIDRKRKECQNISQKLALAGTPLSNP